ncbi:hypothetical protein [Hyphomonas sp.]|uniref:hypothetical protein n=1 Tax=Hyphomonas sp. TaxID=87 RepID=UPI000C8EEC16|nr:hypothetical protein [Hyphomonas sp.]MAL45908.1 hypothetical protein [Hyphomonas sp.]|tara:strand:+ start:2014 stop:2655 length:642 start_codon:yes stop_codon:yes gene_type:complete
MTESDNQFFNIDVFGSWMDVGLAVGMFVIGFAFVFKSILGLRKSKGCSPFKQQSIAVHSRVHEQLTELRVLTGAGRAQICMFHNGGTFESGSSMKKFSVTHESLALAIESTLQKKKEMVVSAFTHLIEHVSKDDPSPLIVSQMEDSFWKSFLISQRVLMTCNLPIFCQAKGTIVGYLCLEWCSLKHMDDADDEKIQMEMEEKRSIVQALISEG